MRRLDQFFRELRIIFWEISCTSSRLDRDEVDPLFTVEFHEAGNIRHRTDVSAEAIRCRAQDIDPITGAEVFGIDSVIEHFGRGQLWQQREQTEAPRKNSAT